MITGTHFQTINFSLPDNLSCPLPTEERKVARDEVRLLVTNGKGESKHRIFRDLPSFLEEGDVLVVNISATIPAALPVQLAGGYHGRLHLSTKLPGNDWLAEIRIIEGQKTKRWRGGSAGMSLSLPGSASVTLKDLFYGTDHMLNLWKVNFDNINSLQEYLKRYAWPVQYERLNSVYPLEYYQTYFSFKPGSSEMPSAARGFSNRIVTSLLQKGVKIVPVLLHTGLSSLEEDEAPYPEYVEIDPVTAAVINNAKASQKRIIAVGTTAIRALETAADDKGGLNAFKGYTDLYIQPDHEMKVVNALITGFHEPRASHLHILQSLAGHDHIQFAYDTAIRHKYYWHQFGDLHLILAG